MIMDILRYGDPRLERPADPVMEIDGQLKKLVEDMFETMYAVRGVGLAANQLGVLKRLFIMDCSGGKDAKEKYVFINPQILSTEGESIDDEGCLSFPGIYLKVARPKRVVATGLDMNGKEFTVDVMDLVARCVSHEVDHLDGELFIDLVSAIKRDFVRRKIKKLVKAGGW
jgi:peptide deformylase